MVVTCSTPSVFASISSILPVTSVVRWKEAASGSCTFRIR